MLSIRTARRLLAAAASLAAYVIAPSARAQDRMPPFGRAGQVVFDDLIGLRTSAPGYLGQLGYGPALGANASTISGPGYAALVGYGHYESESSNPLNPRVVSNAVWFAPAIDVFVAPRISIGAAVGVAYSRQNASDPPANTPSVAVPQALGWTVSAVPRVGYVIPLAPRLALWPRVGVGYSYGRYESGYSAATATVNTSSTWLGGLDVKLVFQATRHVFFDVAPAFMLRYTVTDAGGDVTKNFLAGMGGTVGMGVVL